MKILNTLKNNSLIFFIILLFSISISISQAETIDKNNITKSVQLSPSFKKANTVRVRSDSTRDFVQLSSSNLSKKLKKISSERLKGISTGLTGKKKVSRIINSIRGNLRPSFSKNFKDCGFGVCICTGDEDCDDLFSNECRDYSSGGSCSGSGDNTICVCYPNALK